MLDSKLIICQENNEWCYLKGTINKTFISIINSSIKNPYQNFDKDKKYWIIHWTKLPILVKIATRLFTTVDYSTLPKKWQDLISEENTVNQPSQIKSKNYYEILFLTPQAPEELIKAAYKILSKSYHPDHGGTHEKMSELNLAYQELQKLKKI